MGKRGKGKYSAAVQLAKLEKQHGGPLPDASLTIKREQADADQIRLKARVKALRAAGFNKAAHLPSWHYEAACELHKLLSEAAIGGPAKKTFHAASYVPPRHWQVPIKALMKALPGKLNGYTAANVLAKEPFFQKVRGNMLASPRMENAPIELIMSSAEALAPLNILSPANVYRLYDYFRSNIPLPEKYTRFGEYGPVWADVFLKYLVANTYAAMERPMHTKGLDGNYHRNEYMVEDYWRTASHVLAESRAVKTSHYDSPWVLKDIRVCFIQNKPLKYHVSLLTPAELYERFPFMKLPLSVADEYDDDMLEKKKPVDKTDFTQLYQETNELVIPAQGPKVDKWEQDALDYFRNNPVEREDDSQPAPLPYLLPHEDPAAYDEAEEHFAYDDEFPTTPAPASDGKTYDENDAEHMAELARIQENFKNM